MQVKMRLVKIANFEQRRFYSPLRKKRHIIDDAHEEGFRLQPTSREHAVYPHQVEERDWKSRLYSKHLLKPQQI